VVRRQPAGKFAVVTDATKIQVKGGVEGLVQRLSGQGVSAEPPLLEAAEALAKRAKWAGRVRGVFRYGGRILIVVGIAADVWKVYHAQDKVKAIVESAGGWAGATAGAAAFAAWFAPGDAAGPWAWAAHGVGTLIAGGPWSRSTDRTPGSSSPRRWRARPCGSRRG
jgi:pyruvate-formate lyase-activating enzyme